jgi:TRAP-type C4-dicarboxylate transport system permease large subunit
MGNVATETGMSRRLYDAAYATIGSIRGGLASATVIGCGGFAALSGSSVASALTMGKVSLGEMDRFKYDPRLSTGVVAAGGTLGILIPPSTGFVIYAILAQESIGRLFLAGVLPGPAAAQHVRADSVPSVLGVNPRDGARRTENIDEARRRAGSRVPLRS